MRIPRILHSASVALVAMCFARGAASAHGGIAPTPDTLLSVWRVPPAPAIGLLLVGWLYWRGTLVIWSRGGVGRGISRRHAMAFTGGLAVLAIAVLSPLETLGDALLSAHMVQHLLLLVVAPPLLVLGRPLAPLMLALPRSWRSGLNRRWRGMSRAGAVWSAINAPLPSWFIAAVALWGWHLPLLYEAAVTRPVFHDVEHAMFLGSSLLFWWVVLQPLGRPSSRRGLAMGLLFTTALEGSALGMLMTFASEPWYPIYSDRVGPWHLTPLQDQQLAGVAMWVPSGIAYLIAILCLLYGLLQDTAQQSVAASRA